MAKVILTALYQKASVGLRLLAAHLQENGHAVHTITLKGTLIKLCDTVEEHHHGYQCCGNGFLFRSGMDVQMLTDKELDLFKKCIAAHKPDIIGLSAFTLHEALFPQIMPVLTSFSPDVLLVTGGFGPTLAPERYLKAGFDVVIKGDGEEALLELVNSYERKVARESLYNIPNTVWKTENGDIHNPMRPMCRDISAYPPPLYGHFYHSHIDNDQLTPNCDYQKKERIYATLIGRGCIGSCNYCVGGQWPEFYKKDSGSASIRRRSRSLDVIFAELKAIEQSEYDFITFSDELVTMSSSKLREFMKWYKENISLPFWMYLSYEQLLKNPDIVELAIDAGWTFTGVGIQSSEEFSKKWYNRNTSNDTYIAYTELLFKYDIGVELQFIGGNCYETSEDFRKTIALIRKFPFSITFPGKIGMTCIRLFPEQATPLLELCPRVLTDPMPAKEWFRRALLMNLARVLPENIFEEVYTDSSYDDPFLLQSLYFLELAKLQRAYYENLLQQWKGKRIAFYGMVDLLLNNYSFFKQFQPECILMNNEFITKKKKLFKLPIHSLEDFLQTDKDIRIICFFPSGEGIKRKIIALGLPENQIEICTCELNA